MWRTAFPSRRPAVVHICNISTEACRLVSRRLNRPGWHLAYHSRSGPPNQPWLEPDVPAISSCAAAQRKSLRDVVVAPIGSICEHIEVVYDLDVELGQMCEELGINLVRADVVGSHPRFVRMVRELVLERTEPGTARQALGMHCPAPDRRAAE